MSLVCIAVVFTALILLFLVYSLIGHFSSRNMARKAAPAEKEIDSSGAEAAAIALALNLYMYGTENGGESGTITIKPHESSWNIGNYTKKNI